MSTLGLRAPRGRAAELESPLKNIEKPGAAGFTLEKPYRLFRKKRAGAAVVEFAIVAPVFILLIFGMIEFGRMVMVHQILTNASREGARRAVLDGATAAEIETLVDDYLENSSIQGATITIDPADPAAAAFGDPITVSVTIPFDEVSWIPMPMYLGGVDMTAAAVMRRETVD